jgi:hypothetical protein
MDLMLAKRLISILEKVITTFPGLTDTILNAELKNLVSQLEMTAIDFLTVIQMFQIGRQISTRSRPLRTRLNRPNES